MIQAAAVALATATAVSIAPTRTAYASVLANASVTVTLSQNKIVHGFVNTGASAFADIGSNVTYSGSVNAVAGATGNVFALRTFLATASGNATSDGYALVAQQLGKASVNGGCSVVNANAHIVKRGACNATAAATGTASGGDVKRYGLVSANCGAIAASVDAKIKLRGDSFYRNDGYCDAIAAATATIDSTKTSVSTTLGVFSFGNSSAINANAHIVYHGAANVNTSCVAQPAIATLRFLPTISQSAQALAVNANGVRMVLPTVNTSCSATAGKPKAKMIHAGSAYGSATAFAVNIPVNKVFYGNISSQATATIINCNASVVKYGRVSTALATAIVGKAYGITNSEIRAPDSRYMIVDADDRAMIVDNDDRTMLVVA